MVVRPPNLASPGGRCDPFFPILQQKAKLISEKREVANLLVCSIFPDCNLTLSFRDLDRFGYQCLTPGFPQNSNNTI
jgi:hypothetical protein